MARIPDGEIEPLKSEVSLERPAEPRGIRTGAGLQVEPAGENANTQARAAG